jgi:proteasome lid subunit RPN8/RPN11
VPIQLTPDQLEQIRQHGQSTYPEECGGLLLGHRNQEGKQIIEILSLENSRADSRHNRVELAPLDYLRAEKRAAAAGLGVWGYYHSHPDHLAVPSQFDLDHAPMVDWSYLIVPVAKGVAGTARSWKLAEDRSEFKEETIIERSNP